MKNKNNATNNVAERKLSGSTDVPTSVLLKNGQQEEHQNGLELQGSEKKESNGIGHSNMINGYSKSSQQTAASNEQATAEITGDNQNDTLSSSLAPSSMGLTEQRTEEPDIEKEGDEDAAVSGPDSPSLKNGFLHFHPQIKEQCDVPCRKDFIKTLDDSEEGISRPKKIYRVVLTGGPCGGKTTGQARLCTFFENLGWKVYRVPEAATVLLGGGIKFGELNESTAIRFQEELLRTMMQIESVFFRMAETVDQDVLIICDRGTMDASAFIKRSYWEDILARNNLNEVDIRDTRYNQIIHMVSAANGAEPFYTTEDHICRSEGISLARHLDKKAAQAWVGHPYFDVVDNSTDFESKVCRMIQVIIEGTKLCGDTVDQELRKIFGDEVVERTTRATSMSVSRSSSSSASSSSGYCCSFDNIANNNNAATTPTDSNSLILTSDYDDDDDDESFLSLSLSSSSDLSAMSLLQNDNSSTTLLTDHDKNNKTNNKSDSEIMTTTTALTVCNERADTMSKD